MVLQSTGLLRHTGQDRDAVPALARGTAPRATWDARTGAGAIPSVQAGFGALGQFLVICGLIKRTATEALVDGTRAG